MKILYTGPLRHGSLTEARYRALASLGCEMVPLDQAPYLDYRYRWLSKLQIHTLFGPGIANYNHDLVAIAKRERPDVVYIDTGSYLWPATVTAIAASGTTVVHYSSEHFGHMRHFYRHFVKTIPTYHLHLVTHPEAVGYLQERGAQRVALVEFGYDPVLHQRPKLTEAEFANYSSDAVFVGHWEPTTERHVAALRTAGINVRVWGPGWRRFSRLSDRATIAPIYGEEYIKILASAKICLCFLSKWNRTNYAAGRSFEIPAVGGFLLAERTDAHRKYYQEGHEAEFFDGSEELVTKARFYLANPDKRDAIAAAGHARCMRSGYSHNDRCAAILSLIRDSQVRARDSQYSSS